MTNKVSRPQRRHLARQLNTRTMEWVETDTLRPDPRNPRTHDDRQIEQIRNSIARFGFTVPILVDENLTIIAGHGRLEAAKRAGLTAVAVIKLHGLSPAERRALAIADNKIALNSDWNANLLADALVEVLNADDLDVSITGFETVEIDNILAVQELDARSCRDDVVPAAAATAVSRLGDIWQCGPHRVICASALEGASYEALMGDEKARMSFQDAPYNVPIGGHVSGLGRRRHREFLMGSNGMAADEFADFLTMALRLTAEHCMDGAIVFACMDWRHIQEMVAAGRRAGLTLKNLIVWSKDNGGMGAFYRSRHELIFPFKVGSAQHINNFGLGGSGRYRTNVWSYPGANSFHRGRDTDLAMHPTVKPVALVADAIKDVSNRGDLVLDPFGGSGSTMIASEKTGRVARLIELDPLYVDVIVKRWDAVSRETARLVGTGETFAQRRDARESRNEP